MKKVLIALGALAVVVVAIVLAVGTAFSGKKSVGKVIAVEQKPERVFEVLTSFEKLPELGLGVKKVTLPKDGSRPGVGYKLDLETDFGPAKAEVTTFDEPRALGLDITVKGRKLGNLAFEMAGGDGGTTDVSVTLNLDSPPPLGGIYNLSAQWGTKSVLDGKADKIKEMLETTK